MSNKHIWRPFLLWVYLCWYFTDVDPSTLFILIFKHLTHVNKYFGIIHLSQILYRPLFGYLFFLQSLSLFPKFRNWIIAWTFGRSGGSYNTRRFFLSRVFSLIRRFFLSQCSTVLWDRSMLLSSCMYVSNNFLTAFMITSISITLNGGSGMFILAKHKYIEQSLRALSHVLRPVS